jgi:hypothetical protein
LGNGEAESGVPNGVPKLVSFSRHSVTKLTSYADYTGNQIMISKDEALARGANKYRELYPEEMIPRDLEEQAVLTTTHEDEITTLLVTYSIEGQKDPYVLFKVDVNRLKGNVVVLVSRDWHELETLELVNPASM